MLDSMGAIIEEIPSLVHSNIYCFSPAPQRFRLGELLRQCQERYIPRLLEVRQQNLPWNCTQQAGRQRRVSACMIALQALASDLHFDVRCARETSVMREDETFSIANLADCTAARLTYQAQLGVVYSARESHDKDMFMKCY